MPRLLSINVGQPKDADWAGIGRTSIDKHAGDRPGRGDRAGRDGRPGLRHRPPRRGRPGRLRLRSRGPRLLGGRAGPADPRRPVRREPHDRGHRPHQRRGRAPGCRSARWCSRSPASGRPATTSRAGWRSAASTTPRGSSGSLPSGARGPTSACSRPGSIAAGDAIEVVHEPDHGITVRDLFVALNLDRSRLPELLAIDGLAPEDPAEGRRLPRR